MVTKVVRRCWRRRCVVAAGLVACLAGVLPAPAARGSAGPAGWLASGDGGLRWTLGDRGFTLRPTWADGRAWLQVTAPGLAPGPARPGEPELPVAGALVGIPPGGEPQVSAVAADSVVVPLTAPILPAGTAQAIGDSLAPAPLVLRRADPLAYGHRGWQPAPLAEIAGTGWVRGQRVARLIVRPFQYDAVRGQLRVHRRLRVVVRTLPAADSIVEVGWPAPVAADDPFGDLLDAALVNAAEARAWRQARGPAAAAADDPPPAPSEAGPVWNLHVATTGLQRVTGAELVAAGLPADVDPRRLTLYRAGLPVAVSVSGEADGRLDAADALRFYGRAEPTRYSGDSVYQLAVGDGPGPRIAERAAQPAGGAPTVAFTDTMRVEEDLVYRSDFPRLPLRQPAPAGVDHWLWRQVSAPEAVDVSVSLSAVAPGDWTAELRVAVVGKSALPAVAPDHSLRVLVNGNPVGTGQWDGNTATVLLSMAVPAELLRAASLRVTLAADGTPGAEYDHFFVDWVEIVYRRSYAAPARGLAFTTDPVGPVDVAVTGLPVAAVTVLDVTEPNQPVRLTGVQLSARAPYTARFRHLGAGGRSYLVLPAGAEQRLARLEARPRSALVAPPVGADYLAIGPPDFLSAIQPLLDHRARQGLRVAAVQLQSVYDAFGGGQAAPEAIRALIAHAYAQWPGPPPSHVLLVGDGTYDPRDRLATGTPSFLPPFLREADPWLGEVAAENAFVAVSGDDLLPDLFLGRLPVSSVAEAAAVAAKIVAYETQPAPGGWRRRVLFAADNADGAGDFAALSEAVAQASVPAGYALQRVYLGANYSSADAARAALLVGLDEGYLLTHYAGHGLMAGWAQELMLRRSDMAALANGGRLPVMLDMTCMTGFFANPSQSAIAEAALRAPAGGAVASFSPTGFGVATGHDVLARAFLDRLFGAGEARLGALAVGAKLALGGASTAHDDLLETFAVFGDPALTINLPDLPTPPPPATVTPTGNPAAPPTATATRRPPGGRVYLPWMWRRRR